MPVATDRAEGVQPPSELMVRSMNRSHGFGPITTVRPRAFSAFCLTDDPNGLWVAEDAGQILGFAFKLGLWRGWFINRFWIVAPELGSNHLKPPSDILPDLIYVG